MIDKPSYLYHNCSMRHIGKSKFLDHKLYLCPCGLLILTECWYCWCPHPSHLAWRVRRAPWFDSHSHIVSFLANNATCKCNVNIYVPMTGLNVTFVFREIITRRCKLLRISKNYKGISVWGRALNRDFW